MSDRFRTMAARAVRDLGRSGSILVVVVALFAGAWVGVVEPRIEDVARENSRLAARLEVVDVALAACNEFLRNDEALESCNAFIRELVEAKSELVEAQENP